MGLAKKTKIKGDDSSKKVKDELSNDLLEALSENDSIASRIELLLVMILRELKKK
ncbi:hypothetical protein GOV11_04165 [Candidatus Woesearchaeota archaeon]|nr:hypothetical protein [Candidatus Woesearchaeota archaeon]